MIMKRHVVGTDGVGLDVEILAGEEVLIKAEWAANDKKPRLPFRDLSQEIADVKAAMRTAKSFEDLAAAVDAIAVEAIAPLQQR